MEITEPGRKFTVPYGLYCTMVCLSTSGNQTGFSEDDQNFVGSSRKYAWTSPFTGFMSTRKIIILSIHQKWGRISSETFDTTVKRRDE